MWNICRAQCPNYLIDKDIFGSRRSAAYSTKPPLAPKPVTTLSPSFWLDSAASDKAPLAASAIITSSPVSNRTDTNPAPSPLTLNGSYIVNEQPVRKTDTRAVNANESNNQSTHDTQHNSEKLNASQNTSNMDSQNPANQTEYKRSFVWSKPMIEVAPPAPEPALSSYQISYGGGVNRGGHVKSGYHSDQHTNSISVSSTDSRSPTPSVNIREQVHTREARPPQQHSVPPGPAPAEQFGQGPEVLFHYEPAPRPLSPIDLNKQSEYHAKFKPFDDYVYVESEGKFKKQTNATKLVAASSVNGVSPPASAAKAWFVEVEERSKQVCKYRARSQNGATPINPDHPWDGVTIKDRSLAALALATRLIVEEKRQERKARSSSAKPTSRSSQARLYLNSAPASLRDQHSADSSTKAASKSVPRKAAGKASPVTLDRNNNVGPAKPPIAPPKKAPITQSAPKESRDAKGPEAKVWLKPKKKPEPASNKTTEQKDSAAKPVTKPAKVEQKKPTEPPPAAKVFDPEPKSVPLRTTEVKSPEELTGIKSPSPESWKVSIEKGGLNWVNGTTPVNFDGKAPGQGLVKPVPVNVSASINDDFYGPLSA